MLRYLAPNTMQDLGLSAVELYAASCIASTLGSRCAGADGPLPRLAISGRP